MSSAVFAGGRIMARQERDAFAAGPSVVEYIAVARLPFPAQRLCCRELARCSCRRTAIECVVGVGGVVTVTAARGTGLRHHPSGSRVHVVSAASPSRKHPQRSPIRAARDAACASSATLRVHASADRTETKN